MRYLVFSASLGVVLSSISARSEPELGTLKFVRYTPPAQPDRGSLSSFEAIAFVFPANWDMYTDKDDGAVSGFTFVPKPTSELGAVPIKYQVKLFSQVVSGVLTAEHFEKSKTTGEPIQGFEPDDYIVAYKGAASGHGPNVQHRYVNKKIRVKVPSGSYEEQNVVWNYSSVQSLSRIEFLYAAPFQTPVTNDKYFLPLAQMVCQAPRAQIEVCELLLARVTVSGPSASF